MDVDGHLRGYEAGAVVVSRITGCGLWLCVYAGFSPSPPTSAFSKKVENTQHAVSLYFMYYNFARIHSTLRVTPAMEAGISQHVWTIEAIVGLLEEC